MERDTLLTIVKLFRRHQERILQLERSVSTLKIVAARIGGGDLQQALQGLASMERQFQEVEPDREAREQLDALIAMVEHGKTSGDHDA